MIVVFKRADLPVNAQILKLSYFEATYKYANYVDFMLYKAMYFNHIVLFEQYCAIWVIFVVKWTLGLHFICATKSASPLKKYDFCVESQNVTLSRFTSNSGHFVHRIKSVANNISKNLNSHKMSFLWLNSLEVGWASKNFGISGFLTRPIKDPSTLEKWKLFHRNRRVFCLSYDV